MAKIDRYNGNLEAPASAALGTERTIFGTGSQSDDLTDQFNAFLLRGWGIVGPSDQPTLQDFNAMGFTLGQIHAYLHQMGVAEYNAAQEYHTGSITNVAGVLYVSLVNNNVGNAPASSPAQWSQQSDHGMVVLTSTQSWSVPLAMQLGIIKPKVTVYGGGGGGARSSVVPGPSGGGGGGIAIGVVDLSGVPTVSVTVGLGGTGGAADPSIGANGGSSAFGGFMSATGGTGGANSGASAPGGIGTGGSINQRVGTGQIALRDASGTSFWGGMGGGGESPFGSSGTPTPDGFGQGGAGRSGAAGVNGAAGAVIIEW